MSWQKWVLVVLFLWVNLPAILKAEDTREAIVGTAVATALIALVVTA